MKRLALVLAVVVSSGCMVGPKYSRPAPSAVPPAFHEAPPAGWKEAQPDDGKLKGKWWEMFGEPDLNALEEQVAISNQNVLAAEAQFRAARDSVRIARAALFPTISTGPSLSNSRTPNSGNAPAGQSTIHTSYNFPVDFSYQADIFGAIHRSVTAAAEQAQASDAQLENAKLTYQAELAQDYFQLRATRSNEELLQRTVKSYQEYLDLTKNRFNGGVASGGDVAQAETQLYGAQTQLIDVEIAQKQFEHAIAILTGKPPANMASSPLNLRPPPVIPLGVPSALLERRPDIAAFERQMAAANEQIGIATATLYPNVNLTAGGGITAAAISSAPGFAWQLGASTIQTLFDAGKRRAQIAQQSALYDVTVANYRQTVLTAFQQVEDSLAALRVLENEAKSEAATVDAGQRSLQIATDQYKAGTTSYLTVITAQTALFQAERGAVDVQNRRMTMSVMLIEALGGGWDASSLPSIESLKLRP